jgi:tetratricopeptide (TPR) repeat protein
MKIIRIVALFVVTVTSAASVRGSVPIVVATPQRLKAAMKLVTDAQDLLQKGDVAGAKRNVDAALNADPTMWPALYVRAQIFASQGKYDLAIKDCNEALRQYRGCVEAALLRANINTRLGKYAEALKEFNSLASLHPRSVTLARVLSDRAWFYSTCPNISFRNGQQAIKDAKAACSIMIWKDENMIDTLATAYAEVGDFNSAVQYAQQALAIKGISPTDSKKIQRHLELFQQHKPICL